MTVRAVAVALVVVAALACTRPPATDAARFSGLRITLPDLRHAPAFPGIDAREADRFWERWQLVTVRYRKDNGEQRFIYANDIAWEAIRAGRDRYPDGAMFGKVALQTRDDPLFPNSVVPASASRVQLMRKDAAAFASSDGWAYALYGADGGDGNVENMVNACHACHRVAASRDFVFALALDLDRPAPEAQGFAALFQPRDGRALGSVAQEALASAGLPPDARVRVLEMPLFTGSVSESIAPVASAAAESGEPFVLVDERTRHFLVARPASDDGCNARVVLQTRTGDALAQRRGSMCDGVMRFDAP